MNFLKELIAVTENQYASVVNDGIKAGDIRGYVSTGSYLLNGLLGGSIYTGLVDNRITVFAGETSVGKTYLVLDIVKNFLEERPNGLVMYFESESALTKPMLAERGIDVKRVGIIPVDTVQNFRTQCIKMLDKYMESPEKDRVPLMFCLDSLGMLSTTKEMEDTAAGKETADMTRAKLIKALFRTITLKLGIAGVPLVITNHTYDEQGMFAKKIMAGGSGIALSSSTTVFLSKRKDKDGTDVIGNFITCTLRKARLTKENSQCEIKLDYKKGMHKYHGLLDLGVKHDVFKKLGNKYDLGNGEKYFEKHIMKHADTMFTEEIMAKLDDASKKEYLYGTQEEIDNIEEEIDITEETEE